jgi:hypothetical protein
MLSTFIAAALLASPLGDNTRAAIDFLRTMQSPSGGFISDRPPKEEEPQPTIRTTRTALRVFRMLGGQPADRDAVIRFLNGCYDPKSGGFAARPGLEPDPISTSVALMVMQELKLPTEPYVKRGLAFMNEHTRGFEQVRMVAAGLEELHATVPNQKQWLRDIDDARNPDGSYGKGPGKARSSALYVVAQQRLGEQPGDPQGVLKILREGQRDDGGWGNDAPGGSDLESCYRVVRLFARLDAQPDDGAKLRSFIDRCRNADGGYGRRPGDPSSLHGTYYATIINLWLDGGGRG